MADNVLNSMNSNDMEARHDEPSASEEVGQPSSTKETAAAPTTADQYNEMLQLMKQHIEISQKISQGIEKATTSPALSQEILDVLRKMDERQENADVSRKPIPQGPATSAAAWSPLLRSHLENIQPSIDRWRGTLDTLLVFVGLFSAIVTTFFTQSLLGLSQDPGDRTNELLQNLTEILIATSGVNASQLTIQSPVAFEPEGSAVRLNVYWSISLTLSISVAALAVICRGYVSMLTRSTHTQAHKRLGDLHRRSEEAKKLLAPAVEYLPHLLIPPVILFIMGLLDTVISSAIPVSDATAAILFAGLLSATFIMAVAIYALWTVYHGLSHPDVSPFQSTLLNAYHAYKPPVVNKAKEILRRLRGVCRRWATSLRDIVLFFLPRTAQNVSWEAQIHDDKDQPTDPRRQCYRRVCRRLITVKASRAHSYRYIAESDEIDSLCYMLSDEASLRANITVAAFMSTGSIRNERDWRVNVRYSPSACARLLTSLIKAAERYSLSVSGQPHSHVLWDSAYISAIKSLALSLDFDGFYKHFCVFKTNPGICLLLKEFPKVPGLDHTDTVTQLLLDVLESKASIISSQVPESIAVENLSRFLLDSCAKDQSRQHNPYPGESFSPQDMSRILLKWIEVHDSRWLYGGVSIAQKALIQWMARYPWPTSYLMFKERLDFILLIFSSVIDEIHVILMMLAEEHSDPGLYGGLSLDLAESPYLHLAFILKEINLVLNEVPDSLQQYYNDTERLVNLACVDLILVAQVIDNSHMKIVNRLDYTYLHNIPEWIEHHDDAVCTVLCRLKPEIIRLVWFINQVAPETRLKADVWELLKQALFAVHSRSKNELDAPLESIPSWGQKRKWSPACHREQVKQDIFDAMQFLKPSEVISERNYREHIAGGPSTSTVIEEVENEAENANDRVSKSDSGVQDDPLPVALA